MVVDAHKIVKVFVLFFVLQIKKLHFFFAAVMVGFRKIGLLNVTIENHNSSVVFHPISNID